MKTAKAGTAVVLELIAAKAADGLPATGLTPNSNGCRLTLVRTAADGTETRTDISASVATYGTFAAGDASGVAAGRYAFTLSAAWTTGKAGETVSAVLTVPEGEASPAIYAASDAVLLTSADPVTGEPGAGAIKAASLAADLSTFGLLLAVARGATGVGDQYQVAVESNASGAPIAANRYTGVPTLTVIQADNATNVISASNLTQVGSTGWYRLTGGTGAKLASGKTYIVRVQATIDGVSRTLETGYGESAAS